ncbi:MAG: tetratricopeptide repeat protein [Phaeodactylibacter sp.]|uniref:tetratricopeptide repeat protein n=1 Tax=Phaeodactylibacter sp. TaxID=1940289 RepID=UPI0032EB1A67
MQKQRLHIVYHIGFLVLLALSGKSQSDVVTEHALQDSLEQAKGGKDYAYWLKELAWHYKSDRPATAHSYANSSLEIARQLNDQEAIADALHVEGAIFWYQGNVAEASKAFFQALEIREKINDRMGLARSYNNIGNLYSWQNNLEEATRYYKRSMDLRQELKDHEGRVYSLVSLAEVAAKQNRLKQAEQYGVEALELARRIGKPDAEAFCYEHLGQIMLSKNQLGAALDYFQDAAVINRKQENQNQLADNLREIAEVKTREGDFQTAINSLYKSVDISRGIGAKDLEAMGLKKLSENFAALQQYDSAYFYAINYEDVDEKITSDKQARILFDVQEQYRSQMEKTGLLLKQQRSNRLLIWISAISVLLLIVYVYFIGAKNRRLQHTERQVKEKAEEIERVNKALAIHNEDLRQSNDALRQFAYVVSHDLREPLRTIGSFTTLLARRFPKHIDAQSQEYIDFIVKGTEHMSLLLDGLLTYAHVSNTEVLDQEPLNLNQLIKNILEILDTEVVERKTEVYLDNLPVVMGNRALLSQLFQNLIANALKFNDKPEKKVWIHYQSTGNMHQVTVEDNGIGIDESYKSKVFQIFHRLEKNKYKGTGLGLAICQKIVARHRGKIELASEPGKGTRFTVHLPKQA